MMMTDDDEVLACVGGKKGALSLSDHNTEIDGRTMTAGKICRS
jgi:hypothetical protein